MAFKSSDKRRGDFCDKTSQVAQRQMIIPSLQVLGRLDVICSSSGAQAKNSDLLAEQAAPLQMTKEQESEHISFWQFETSFFQADSGVLRRSQLAYNRSDFLGETLEV
jgi:hypothetical protein